MKTIEASENAPERLSGPQNDNKIATSDIYPDRHVVNPQTDYKPLREIKTAVYEEDEKAQKAVNSRGNIVFFVISLLAIATIIVDIYLAIKAF